MINFKSYASGSKGNLYTVDDGETRIMLECGVPWAKLQKSLNFQTSTIAGALLTHAHKDHSVAAKDVMFHGIDIWTSQETLGICGLSGSRIHTAKPLEPFRVGSWQIVGMDVCHDAEGALAWLMTNKNGEHFLFAIDAAYIKYRFPPLSVIAIEANFNEDIIRENVDDGSLHPALKKRIYGTHLSIQRVVDLLKANDLSRLSEVHLVHLSQNNSDAVAFKTAVQQITGCRVYAH